MPKGVHGNSPFRRLRKLSDLDVLEIRRLHKVGNSTRQIARMFNVSQPAVWRIVTRQARSRIEEGRTCPECGWHVEIHSDVEYCFTPTCSRRAT